jgi:hypothetical protein
MAKKESAIKIVIGISRGVTALLAVYADSGPHDITWGNGWAIDRDGFDYAMRHDWIESNHDVTCHQRNRLWVPIRLTARGEVIAESERLKGHGCEISEPVAVHVRPVHPDSDVNVPTIKRTLAEVASEYQRLHGVRLSRTKVWQISREAVQKLERRLEELLVG